MRTRLTPAGGAHEKVFPPTYQGGRYALEKRLVDGKAVDVVLLDSVASQANRMELALLAAWQRGSLRFPLLSVDFGTWEDLPIRRITALEAPHRIADAVFRDSFLDGTAFRDSEPGRRFVAARVANATAMLELCPTALIFGVWDSTGPLGGLGAKFQRALVSEIVGFDAVVGVRTASRVDPLPIRAEVPVYQAEPGQGAPYGWTVESSKAQRDAKGVEKPFRKKGKASELNLGNVTPDLVREERGNEPLPGGVTISHAEQTTLLSLVALRRLGFPKPATGERSPEADLAAQTLLASLSLAAVVHQRQEGYDLRSRCLLLPDDPQVFEFLGPDGNLIDTPVTLGVEESVNVFEDAVRRVREVGLPWPTRGEEEIRLTPSEELVQLIRLSMQRGTLSEGEE
nr:type I-U CRISPR-associated RAMP protein Csb1/Cas7u [Limnochorda pilosa]